MIGGTSNRPPYAIVRICSRNCVRTRYGTRIMCEYAASDELTVAATRNRYHDGAAGGCRPGSLATAAKPNILFIFTE